MSNTISRGAAALSAASIFCALVTVAPPAAAQTPADLYRLQELSRQSAAARGQIRHDLPPPAASIRKERLADPHEMLVCMSTEPFLPVRAAPSASAREIGKTTNQVAVMGPWVRGQDGAAYAQVLHYNGRTGFLPANEVHPFRSTIRPGVTCAIEGLRPDGTPVFAFR